jgi:hypothetical protein
VRAKDGSVGGDRRWLMKEKWPGYGQRWDIETAHSAMKRRLGSTLAAQTPRTLKNEAALIALAGSMQNIGVNLNWFAPQLAVHIPGRLLRGPSLPANTGTKSKRPSGADGPSC